MSPSESAALVEDERRFPFRLANAPGAVRLAAALIAVAIALTIARGPVAVGQTTLNGLVAAGYFSLGAVGLTLVFGSLRIINFAHGDLLTLGAYLTLGMNALGLPFWPAAALAIAATAGVALVLDWIVWEPMRRQQHKHAAALSCRDRSCDGDPLHHPVLRRQPGPRSLGQDVLSEIVVGPFHLGALQALALVVGVAAASLVGLGLAFTRFGKQIRALADDMALAEVSGVDARSMIRLVWLVAGGLAALAGVLYAAAVGSVNPNFGFLILLSLFTAAVLGGIGNAYGALAGGLIVGLAQEWSTLFFNTRWKPVVGFAILILMLLIMPRGIFGSGAHAHELLDADFWVGVGVTAGVYAIFALGLQLNVGFTGLVNLGQAGFMAIGAYAVGMLVVDAGWPLLLALPAAILFAITAGALVGLPTLRLRADYFGVVTIAFSEIARYTLQNAAFAGGNQGVLGYDGGWRDFQAWASDQACADRPRRDDRSFRC